MSKKLLCMFFSAGLFFSSSLWAASVGGGATYSFNCLSIGTNAGWLVKNSDGSYKMGSNVKTNYMYNNMFNFKLASFVNGNTSKILTSNVTFRNFTKPLCQVVVNGNTILSFSETTYTFASCNIGSSNYLGTCSL